MPQVKSKYDQKFKDIAVRYCLEKAQSITQGAKDLQINKCTIFRWVNEYKVRAGSDIKKSDSHALTTYAMKNEFINENKENYTITEMCRVLKVSKSGYYNSLKNREKSKQAEYKNLSKLMIEIENNNNWKLGAEGLRRELAEQGIRCGLSKIHRIKRMYGIYPKCCCKS